MYILRCPFALIYINSLLSANTSTFAFLRNSNISTLKCLNQRFLKETKPFVSNGIDSSIPIYRGLRCRLYSNASNTFYDNVTSISDKIRSDSIILKEQEKGNTQIYKQLLQDCGKNFTHLVNYSKELNVVFKKAAFIGATEFDSKYHNPEVFGSILHFRGFEYAESLCLVFSSAMFPLIPSPAANYINANERTLSYFERIMSGISGLRVKKIHCPYPFRNILSIEFVDAQSITGSGNTPAYEILIICDRVNKLLLLESESQTILLTSECADEKEGLQFGVGKKFLLPEPKHIVPSKNDTFSLFNERFSTCQHMSLIKSMLKTYEGIDKTFVQQLAEKVEVDPLTHVSKIENLESFYNAFYSEVTTLSEISDDYIQTSATSTEMNVDKLQDGPKPQTHIENIYNLWGTFCPIYKHNRLAEKCDVLIKETIDRLTRIAAQCENDPQQAERFAKVSERINSIDAYKSLLDAMPKFRKADEFETLTSLYNEVTALGDLVNYKRLSRVNRKRAIEEKEDKVKKTKDVYKGILILRVNEREDSPMIIVGKNAKQNETVTHEIGTPGDLWLHVRDYPGGHILLRGYKNDENSIQMAADVASFVSKGKDCNNVQVCVAKIENVKKHPGAELGAVSVREYRVVTGHPKRGMRLIEMDKADKQAQTSQKN
ncbi:conserved hypothetical protein [Theileria equi strain WA]|uniref:NFACT RNA-binding domain-containing protein n=1 Tax=Theileria equi strain WA TaxID=1537102 RepID=L1LFG7_THEEQ|nr:conserved hypothetical protein [Theileria equi strain WA]EKX74177.1 conserved hypothetical protein [Theileria equi strain WA]|eukprot:XP_004833629.1 conserved hypothetical protein [Theileria equi strain WA]